MIELLFVTCLVAGGGCEERRTALLPEAGILGCMLSAQGQLAAWVAAHPEHRLERWTCGWAGARGERA
jgi:hypothetical protein